MAALRKEYKLEKKRKVENVEKEIESRAKILKAHGIEVTDVRQVVKNDERAAEKRKTTGGNADRVVVKIEDTEG